MKHQQVKRRNRQQNSKIGLLPILLLATFHAVAQEAKQSLPSMHPIRYEENYDILRLSNEAPLIEKVKRVKLGKSDSYFSIGGEVRAAFEHYDNQIFGLIKGVDNYWLQRVYLHSDFHIKPAFRAFIQLASGLKQGGLGEPLPIQQDKLFLHQAFAELTLSGQSDKRFIIRIGRQELQVGSGRILSTRIGPNIRQSFDAARIVFVNFSKWNYTAFYCRPVINKVGVFDNPTFSTRAPDFWNVAATRQFRNTHADLYYFGYHNNQAVYQQGTGEETRHSVGGRLYKRGLLDYDAEVLYQFGTFNQAPINAYTGSINIGYTFLSTPLKPRIGLKTEYISGDSDPNQAGLQTFNALFPEGGYFGGVNALGPANLYDLHPSVDVAVTPDIHLHSGVTFVWRASLRDGLYNPARFIIVTDTEPNPNRYVGTQVQQTASWDVSRYVAIRLIYGHFFAGEYILKSKPARTDTDFFTGMVTFTF